MTYFLFINRSFFWEFTIYNKNLQMKRIIISERQLPLLKQVLKERRLLKENKTQGKKSKIVIISERQVPLLEKVLRERMERLDEARLNWIQNIPERSYIFDLCNAPNPNEIVWRNSSQSSSSEYYEIKPSGTNKEIIRYSDHWSYYIIPGYSFPDIPNNIRFKGMKFDIIFGSQDYIRAVNKRLYYCLRLKSGAFAGEELDNLVQQSVNVQNNGRDTYRYADKKGRADFIILPKNSFGLFEQKMLYGKTCVGFGDYNIMGHNPSLKHKRISQ